MAITCFACKNISGGPRAVAGVSFHRFPHRDHELLQMWMQVPSRSGGLVLTPGIHSALCSDHFEESLIDRTGRHVRLRKGAIPTLFSEWRHQPVQEWPDPFKPPAESSSHGMVSHTSPKGIKIVTGAEGLQNVQHTDTSMSNNQCYIGVAPEDIKQESDDNFVEDSMNAQRRISIDQDFSFKSEPTSPKYVAKEYDPLSVDVREQLCAMKEEELVDEKDHVLTETPDMKEESFENETENTFSSKVLQNESVSDEYASLSRSNVEISIALPIAEVVSENEDKPEFKEILVVAECMQIEDCLLVLEESPFATGLKGDAKNLMEEENVIENVGNVGTDHRCDVCSAVFDNESNLNSHMIRCLVDWTPFSCTYCGKRFWDKKLFKEHKLGHPQALSKCLRCGWLHLAQFRRCSNCKCKNKRKPNRTNRDIVVSKNCEKIAIKKVPKAKRMQKQTLGDKNCDQTGLKKVSKAKNKQTDKNCDQSTFKKVSKAKSTVKRTQVDKDYDQIELKNDSKVNSKQKQMRSDIFVSKTCDKTNGTKLRRRLKSKQTLAPVEVEEPTTKCPTCERQFMAAPDYQAHTQLVLLCRKRNLEPVPGRSG